MGRIVFVEVLDRRGQVKQRFRMDTLPAVVGRAYSAEAILDDRHICPEHLRISVDDHEAILVEDLGTVNGIYALPDRTRVRKLSIPSGRDAHIRIGHTTLRICGDDFIVRPSVVAKGSAEGDGPQLHAGLAIMLFLASFGVHAGMLFLKARTHEVGAEIVGVSLGFLVLFLLWAGFWSLINRLVGHGFRFLTHLAAASVVSLLSLVLHAGQEYAAFLLSSAVLAEAAATVEAGVVIAFFLFIHLSIVSVLSLRRRLVSSAVAGGVLIAVIGLTGYVSRTTFSTTLEFSNVLKPVDPRWIRAESAEEFFGGLPKLQEKIDDMLNEQKVPPAQ